MSNIAKAFENGKAFIGFVTGGDPSIEKSKEFILEMIRAGANLIEIGIPFSDPIAEGPVIQAANIRALNAGTTVEKLFTLTEDLRNLTPVPIVFLTYLNPVFHYGYDRFFSRCKNSGVDGIIIPDLPYEEQPPVRDCSRQYGIDLISLIAPTSLPDKSRTEAIHTWDDKESSKARIKEIAAAASGFIYIVSSMGVTGTRSKITTDLASIVSEIKALTTTPTAIGFGIHTPEQAAQMAGIADGVIVGSAIVKIIAEHGDKATPHIFQYVQEMKRVLG